MPANDAACLPSGDEGKGAAMDWTTIAFVVAVIAVAIIGFYMLKPEKK